MGREAICSVAIPSYQKKIQYRFGNPMSVIVFASMMVPAQKTTAAELKNCLDPEILRFSWIDSYIVRKDSLLLFRSRDRLPLFEG
jgi:hypothetical protein